MHFCWKDRGNGEVVDDLIIFPDDVMFKHIPPTKISAARCDRIYVLKFKASSRKFFFWMQVWRQKEGRTDRRTDNNIRSEGIQNTNHCAGAQIRQGYRAGWKSEQLAE